MLCRITIPEAEISVKPFVALVLSLCLLSACAKRTEIDWVDIIHISARTESIALLNAQRSVIYTSHDRSGGNDDFSNGFVTSGDGWLTLVDLAGPGVVSRLWFTGIKTDSKVRFFFDGEKVPRFETAYGAMRTGESFLRGSLVKTDQYCFTSYIPIPYQKSLKIQVSDDGFSKGNGKLYYQINVTPLRTETVQSATFPFPSEVRTALDEPAPLSLKRSAGDLRHAQVSVPPGGEKEVLRIDGAATISQCRLNIDQWSTMSFVERCAILNDVWLKIYWDGATEPSVNGPLGAFFGILWQPLSYQSAYLGADGGSFVNRFPMPFRSDARIVLENRSGAEISVKCEASVHVGQPLLDAGYFHLGWNRSGARQAGTAHDILRTKGSGRLAGCLLGVVSQDKSFWVLESDETILVDGQRETYWQGTGLEDYFNGGWYYRSVHASPFYGLLGKRPYRTIQYRHHLSDAVTFSKEIQMSFERGPGHQSNAVFDSVVYYYLAEPSRAFGQSAGVSTHEPRDPLAASSLMTRLWDYERFGDLDNARSLLQHAIDSFGFDTVWREVFELRFLDYTAQIDGFASVRGQIQGMANGESPVAIMARQLIDVYEGRSVLFSLYASKPTELWLNNTVIARAETPLQPVVVAVPLSEERFSLAARSEKAAWPHWVQVAYRTAQLSGGVDRSWRAQIDPKGRWTEPAYDDARWTSVRGYAKGPPEMEAVPFVAPNPFVLLHSQAEGVRPQIAGHEGAGVYVLRKVLELE
jgi:hypothetical protein